MIHPVVDEFMTSLYCEDDLADLAYEVGIEAIRAAKAHTATGEPYEVVYAAIERVVEDRAGDGRRRGARQLRAALDAAATAVPLPDPCAGARDLMADLEASLERSPGAR